MSSVEEYRKRAKEARQQANTSCIELERQGLLIIADQYERIASYKDLTTYSAAVNRSGNQKMLEVEGRPAGRRGPTNQRSDKPR